MDTLVIPVNSDSEDERLAQYMAAFMAIRDTVLNNLPEHDFRLGMLRSAYALLMVSARGVLTFKSGDEQADEFKQMVEDQRPALANFGYSVGVYDGVFMLSPSDAEVE